MARYVPQMGNVKTGIELLPKGTYKFDITDIKWYSREYTGDDGSTVEVFGIQANCRVKDGPKEGKFSFPQFNLADEDLFGIFKSFAMAALGYSSKEKDQEEFNSKYPDEMFAYDPEAENGDNSHLGDIYARLVGKTIVGNLDIKPSKKNPERQYQKFVWLPYSE